MLLNVLRASGSVTLASGALQIRLLLLLLFTATAREHGGMKEKPATKTKKPTQPPLVGRAANSKLKTVVTKRDTDLFVSRLHPSTQISELRDYVADILREQTGDKNVSSCSHDTRNCIPHMTLK